MAAVTQTIPNLVLGISQQPDELMLPGQLKDAKNVFLDVATGLQKRPGAQLVGTAISNEATGKWFSIDRDENEQYIGRIKPDGTVEIWSALDGTPRIVRYQSIPYKDPDAERQSFIATIEANNTPSLPTAKSCDVNGFGVALRQLAKDQAALESKLTEIDLAEQALAAKQESLRCKQIWEYKSNKFGLGASTYDITGQVVSGNNTYSFKQPPITVNQTVSVGDYIKDVDVRIKIGESVSSKSNGVTVTSNVYKNVKGKLYAWKVCYTDAYLTAQTSADIAAIDALKAEVPALEAAVATSKAAYIQKAAECNVFISPYSQVTGADPYVFLSVEPIAVDEGTTFTGTYTRTGTELILTITGHGLSTGDIVNLDFTSGGGTDGNYPVTVVDRDTLKTIDTATGTTSGNVTLNTGLQSIVYTFTRFGTLSGTTNVYYSVGGTATINVDYTISGDNTVSPTATNRQVTFTANQSVKTVTVTPVRDSTFESNETLYFQIKSDNTYGVATTIPVYSGLLNDDIPEAGEAPIYLQHVNPDDLRILTINDYTFVTNRTAGPVSMSKTDTTARPYEAFIELTQVAYGKQYAINLNYYATGQSSSTVSSAETINVITSTWTGTDGACPYIDTDVFDINPSTGSSNPDANWIETVEGYKYYKSGNTWTKADPTYPNLTRKNLRFELATTGQSIPKSYKDARKGYFCRYTTEATLEVGGEGWKVGDKVQVTMSGKKYELTIGQTRQTQTFASAGLIRPTATSTSGSTVLKAADILSDIKTAIDSTTTGFTTQIVGNGIYLKHTLPFSIETPEAQLMNVFTDQVNNITRLPTQCRDGYIVKVINSNEEEDDYYLKFVVKQGNNLNASTVVTTTGGSPSTVSSTAFGEGVWEETVKPGIKTKLNSSTMPYQIVRTPDGDFVVSPIDWEERLVGDDKSNPLPSFVGKYIQGIALCRNRLVLLSDENVVMSRPGDYFNFFAQTALTVTANDPIDIAVGSTKPSSLRAAYPAKAGLLVFGDTEQYLISTSEDVFSPETVQLTSLSNYKFNSKTLPVGLGTSIAFIGDTGKYSSMYEIVEIPTNNEAKIVEQSKLVSSLLPDTLNQIISTKDYSSIFLGEVPYYDFDKEEMIGGTGDVWVFRYFETGERRVQGAWFRWELTGQLLHHTMLSDGYYVVLKNTESITGQDVISIQRFDLKKQEWSTFVQNDNAYSFNVHLDNAKIIYGSEMTYDEDDKKTSFYVPYSYFSDKQLVVYSLSDGDYAGFAAEPTVTYDPDDPKGITITLNGDWTTTRLLLGYTFEMDIKLPTFYVKQSTASGDVRSDTRSSLIVHRVKLNFGDSGIYETTLKRLGHEDYTEQYAVPLYDQYKADAVALKERYVQTVPIYARNIDTQLHIKSTHPSPATIYSVTWEGDTNNRYYNTV